MPNNYSFWLEHAETYLQAYIVTKELRDTLKRIAEMQDALPENQQWHMPYWLHDAHNALEAIILGGEDQIHSKPMRPEFVAAAETAGMNVNVYHGFRKQQIADSLEQDPSQLTEKEWEKIVEKRAMEARHYDWDDRNSLDMLREEEKRQKEILEKDRTIYSWEAEDLALSRVHAEATQEEGYPFVSPYYRLAIDAYIHPLECAIIYQDADNFHQLLPMALQLVMARDADGLASALGLRHSALPVGGVHISTADYRSIMDDLFSRMEAGFSWLVQRDGGGMVAAAYPGSSAQAQKYQGMVVTYVPVGRGFFLDNPLETVALHGAAETFDPEKLTGLATRVKASLATLIGIAVEQDYYDMSDRPKFLGKSANSGMEMA